MTYQDKLLVGTPTWQIELATQIGTHINNETSVPTISVPLRRQRMEDEFRNTFHPVRPPIYGYNCFGHIFASRRTAIYKPDINLILREDGFGLISEDQAAAADVVIYSDSAGPVHVGRITRITRTDRAQHVHVLSKFDDCSGEYEHEIQDRRWDQNPLQLTWKIYRERHQAPQAHRPDWRTLIGA